MSELIKALKKKKEETENKDTSTVSEATSTPTSIEVKPIIKEPPRPKREKKEVPNKTEPSSIEKKLDLILEKLEKKELLDIELTEENLLREFETVETLKAYELRRVFRNNTTNEIKRMLNELVRKNVLKRKEHGWFTLKR